MNIKDIYEENREMVFGKMYFCPVLITNKDIVGLRPIKVRKGEELERDLEVEKIGPIYTYSDITFVDVYMGGIWDEV